MKSNREPGDEDRLFREVMREWVVDAPLPPRFQDQVWQRIERAEAQRPAAFRGGLLRLVGVALPRPQIAFSYLAALLISGIAAGSLAAQIKRSHLEASLSERYVQSVYPFGPESSKP